MIDETSVDLDAYLARIGMTAPVAPDIGTLRALIAAHTASIPFENLDPFLGVPVAIDLASVQRKLVGRNRGGYCFEQNRLFGDVLRRIGFDVTDLAARVLWGQPEDTITARSHMVLKVGLEGRTWLVDVGFGGRTPTAPLDFTADIEQATPHEAFRLIRPGDGDWRLQIGIEDAWRTLYRFDLQPQFFIDYRVSNYWTSTNPESKFVTSLTVARAAPGRRLTLNNREFAVRAIGGATERRVLRDAGEIRAVLEREFLIRLPDHPDLDRKLVERI
ncbi:MAG TPA: arylamine N-acetyltransferase [Acidiphilium sp.]